MRLLYYKELLIKLLQLGEVFDGSDHLGGVAVLVIVPAYDLDLRVAVAHRNNHGLGGIENRTESGTDNVAGDDFVLIVSKRTR